MFETNLFGAAAVAAGRRSRRCARPAAASVVFVSSIGARISNPLLGMYHASKYGLSAMAEALAVEGRPVRHPGRVDRAGHGRHRLPAGPPA